jgi:hypothetical protein
MKNSYGHQCFACDSYRSYADTTSNIEVIDICKDSLATDGVENQLNADVSGNISSVCTRKFEDTGSKPATVICIDTEDEELQLIDYSWECKVCTFINTSVKYISGDICGMCGSQN